MEARLSVRRLIRKQQLYWLLALVLIPVFLFQAVGLIRDFSSLIASDYRTEGPPFLPNDFPMFYSGARVLTSEERQKAYDKDVMVRTIAEVQGYESMEQVERQWFRDWLRYYNPPAFLLALAPLTLLNVHQAYVVALALNLMVLAAVVATIGVITRNVALTVILAAALIGFTPLYFTLRQAQPMLLITLFIGLAVLAAEGGRRNVAALLFVLAGAKPQFLALPGLALVTRWPAMLLPLVIAGFAVILLPFALLGPRAVVDYVHLILDRGTSDVGSTGFSLALVNWTGFLQAATGGVNLLALVALSVATVVAFFFVLRQQDIRLAVPAALLTTLLIVPHVHIQDWVIMALAAALLLSRPAPVLFKAGTAIGLLGVYFGVNQWQEMHSRASDGANVVYGAVPAAFLLLLWLAAAPLLERIRLVRRTARDTTVLPIHS
jgi:hypothetical protein